MKKLDVSVNLCPLIYLIPLGVIKRISGVKIYLNVIPVIFGIYYWVRYRKFDNFFLPLLIIIIINLYPTLTGDNLTVGLLRLGQFIALIGFTNYLIYKVELKYFLQFICIWEIISIVLFVANELYQFDSYGDKSFLGFNRFSFIVGEPNFSGLLYFSSFLIKINLKKYWSSSISIILMLLTFSRGIALGLTVFILLYVLYKLSEKYFKIIIYILGISIICYPVTLYAFSKLADASMQMYFLSLSPRYYLHLAYINMFLDNPFFGVGYRSGINYLPEYIYGLKTHLIINLQYFSPLEISEQHSLFIQVLSEFGAISYLIFGLFLYKLFSMALKHSEILAISCLSFSVSLLFLNCLSEMSFYMFIAFIIKTSYLDHGKNNNTITIN